MAFTFGITTLIGASLTSHPEITIQLLSELDKSLGIFEHTFYVMGVGIIMLSVIAGDYCVRWQARQTCGDSGLVLTYRPPKLCCNRLTIAILDLSTVALVLYLLLPP